MSQMPSEEVESTPIVTRLEVNLGWKAWLKPFFIHPSVTAGAAHNMECVRQAQAELERAHQVQLIESRVLLAIAAIEEIVDKINGLPERHPILEIKAILNPVLAFQDRSHAGARRIEDLENIFHQACLMLSSSESADRDMGHRLLDEFEGVSPQYDAMINLIKFAEDSANMGLGLTNLLLPRLRDNKQPEAKRFAIWRAINDGIRDDYPKKAELLKLGAALNPNQPAVAFEAEVEPYVHPSHIFQGAFLKVFGLIGFHTSTTELTDAQGREASFDNNNYDKNKERRYPHIPFSLMFWTLIGAPNRLHRGKANLGLREIIRNVFGGWDSLNNGKSDSSNILPWWLHWSSYTFAGKRLWNVILLLTGVKIAIAAVNLAIWAFNLGRTPVRLVAAYLPEVLLEYTGAWYGDAATAFPALYYDEDLSGLQKLVVVITSLLVLIVSFPIHHVARVWAFAGAAFISPERTARSAWDYGRALNSRFGYLFGFLGAAIVLTLTAVLWTLVLTTVLSGALVLFPALAPIVASISQWPVVAAALKVVNGTAVLVAGYLPAAFGLAASAISATLGIKVAATTVAVATTVAFIAAPVGATVSRLADIFGFVWTQWPSYAPLLLSETDVAESAVSLAASSVATTVKSTVAALTPSFAARKVVEDGEPLLSKAEQAAQTAARHAQDQPYEAQTPKDKSKGVKSEPTWELGSSSAYVSV